MTKSQDHSPIIGEEMNHEEARLLAQMNYADSNLARCYLDLWNTRSPDVVTDEMVEELTQALANTLALAKLKWGNLDEDANFVFKRAKAALLKVALR